MLQRNAPRLRTFQNSYICWACRYQNFSSPARKRDRHESIPIHQPSHDVLPPIFDPDNSKNDKTGKNANTATAPAAQRDLSATTVQDAALAEDVCDRASSGTDARPASVSAAPANRSQAVNAQRSSKRSLNRLLLRQRAKTKKAWQEAQSAPKHEEKDTQNEADLTEAERQATTIMEQNVSTNSVEPSMPPLDADKMERTTRSDPDERHTVFTHERAPLNVRENITVGPAESTLLSAELRKSEQRNGKKAVPKTVVETLDVKDPPNRSTERQRPKKVVHTSSADSALQHVARTPIYARSPPMSAPALTLAQAMQAPRPTKMSPRSPTTTSLKPVMEMQNSPSDLFEPASPSDFTAIDTVNSLDVRHTTEDKSQLLITERARRKAERRAKSRARRQGLMAEDTSSTMNDTVSGKVSDDTSTHVHRVTSDKRASKHGDRQSRGSGPDPSAMTKNGDSGVVRNGDSGAASARPSTSVQLEQQESKTHGALPSVASRVSRMASLLRGGIANLFRSSDGDTSLAEKTKSHTVDFAYNHHLGPPVKLESKDEPSLDRVLEKYQHNTEPRDTVRLPAVGGESELPHATKDVQPATPRKVMKKKTSRAEAVAKHTRKIRKLASTASPANPGARIRKYRSEGHISEAVPGQHPTEAVAKPIRKIRKHASTASPATPAARTRKYRSDLHTSKAVPRNVSTLVIRGVRPRTRSRTATSNTNGKVFSEIQDLQSSRQGSSKHNARRGTQTAGASETADLEEPWQDVSEDDLTISGYERIKAADLHLTALDIEQPPVPRLSYGLDRVLFNPGVYNLQDPHSRVYNFDPYLQKPMSVTEFDFTALKEYKTSSKDPTLSQIALEHDKKYVGSTSSMTGTLGHFHYLLSHWRDINVSMLSKEFPAKHKAFTKINQAPNAIFLRWQNGTYAIDADKEYDSANVLMVLGKSFEKLLTLPKSDFERYRKSDPREVTVAERTDPESYHYSTMGDFLMRSQLDAYDHRLPGTGMFDLKTRAVVSIRMDITGYESMSGYQIRSAQGEWESYEREYYDMIRSTMLKYSLQVRMGRMDGIFVAYHNVERMFGFQYLSINEMDRALHGQTDTCLGDQEFTLSLDLLNKAFEKATQKFPAQSIRFHFETRPSQTQPFMYIYAEPMTEEEINAIQTRNTKEVEEYERSLLGANPSSEADSSARAAELANKQTTEDADKEGSNAQAAQSDSRANRDDETVAAAPDDDESPNESAVFVSLSPLNEQDSDITNHMSATNGPDDTTEAESSSPSGLDAIDSGQEPATADDVESAISVEKDAEEDVNPDSAQEQPQDPSDEDIEYSSTDSPADTTFINSMQAADTNQRPVLGMVLKVQSRVNGSSVARPAPLRPEDKWSIDYEFKEIKPGRVWPMYAECMARRRKLYMTLGDEEKQMLEAGEQGALAETEYKPPAMDYYREMLLAISQRGRTWRAEMDEKEAGKEKVVVAEVGDWSEPGVEWRKGFQSEGNGIEGVDDYLDWLYGRVQKKS
ncbi:hypothetical protein LTR66_009567 [Elasticomyces elasticus]|nr:hypothetical protein LTR66_009567 [Elasticomyces elasticus]